MKSTHTRTVLAALLAITLLGVGLALLVEPAEVAPAPAAARTPPDPTAELERGQAIHAYGVSLVLRSMYDIGVYQRALLEAELARQQAAARPRGGGGGGGGRCVDTQPGEYGTGVHAIPEYIVQRESGGWYGSCNESSGACGAYQFMPGTWNNYGGYASACDAPPAVQDEKAAQTWGGGAGCGHWSAC